MSCEYEDDVTAFADGELPPLRARQLEAHLASCARCGETLALVRRTVAAAARAPAFEPSPELRRRVLAQLEAPPGLFARLSALLRSAWAMPALGMAAAAALALVIGAPGARPPPFDSPEHALYAQMGELLEDYDVLGLDSADDLEVVAHLHELSPVEVTP